MRKFRNDLGLRLANIGVQIQAMAQAVPGRLRWAWLSWRYGGIKNVPEDQLGSLLQFKPSPPGQVDLSHMVLTGSALHHICSTLQVEMADSVVAQAFGMYIQAELNDPVVAAEMISIMLSDNYRQRLYQAMIKEGDIAPNRAALMLQPEQFQAFEQWLQEPPTSSAP